MKQSLRSFFSPILSVFEKGSDAYAYKPLNRKILIFMGSVFSGHPVHQTLPESTGKLLAG